MVKKRQRKDFTPEFKNEAIKLVTEQGYGCSEVARRLEINSSNVFRWVREHRRKGQGHAENGISRSELEAQIRQLKKENKRLLMEREILKKAAAIFANDSD